MLIPNFPSSRKIFLEDKAVFDEIFAANPPEVSAYTFTNIFAWRGAYGLYVSWLGDSLLVGYDVKSKSVYWEPFGGSDAKAVISEVFRQLGDKNVRFNRISSKVAALFKDDPAFDVDPVRADFDYLYSAEDLINLAGRKFDAKRNFINRIKLQREYEYVEVVGDVVEECREFVDRWCEEKSCDTAEGLIQEQYAVYEMLNNYDVLGIRGGAIKIDGKIVAFSLGEKLNPETLVVHVEKANTDIDGLYQLINNEFCIHEAQDCKYVNREQDLGIPGLRKAKKSYQPIRMIETYKIKKAQNLI